MTLEIVLSGVVTAVLGGIGLMEIFARRGSTSREDLADRPWPVAILFVGCVLLSNFAIWLPEMLARSGGG